MSQHSGLAQRGGQAAVVTPLSTNTHQSMLVHPVPFLGPLVKLQGSP